LRRERSATPNRSGSRILHYLELKQGKKRDHSTKKEKGKKTDGTAGKNKREPLTVGEKEHSTRVMKFKKKVERRWRRGFLLTTPTVVEAGRTKKRRQNPTRRTT